MVIENPAHAESGHDIIVIGASAGGVETLSRLVAQLPADLPAAVFVVQHTAAGAPGMMAEILKRQGRLDAMLAEHERAFERGRIYVAPPDHHMLIEGDHTLLSRGPRENRVRPALDPLFRSAAVAHGARVVGVVLTGYQNDGTAGMLAIKRCGGTSVIQDPHDATVPDMPRSVLANMHVDHCVTLADMGSLLIELAHTPAPPSPSPPWDIVVESQVGLGDWNELMQEHQVSEPSSHTCPECGGPLRRMTQDSVRRYRCLVGHAYTAETLLLDQARELEVALWAALRVMEERVLLLGKVARDRRARGLGKLADWYDSRAQESRASARTLRDLVLRRAQHTPSDSERGR